ncbi:hypothetical protein SBV1_590057 [Verrucomicrobia bacterium]|nr:hypothetical protein SBV1_590057 [Verrucomicrobiota bacterium]
MAGRAFFIFVEERRFVAAGALRHLCFRVFGLLSVDWKPTATFGVPLRGAADLTGALDQRRT